jgi:hypothetical protein
LDDLFLQRTEAIITEISFEGLYHLIFFVHLSGKGTLYFRVIKS